MIMVHYRKFKHYKFHMEQILGRLKDHNLFNTSGYTSLILSHLIQIQAQKM